MLVDYRIYATIYAVAYAAVIPSMFLSYDNARVARAGIGAVFLVTGLLNFLDWLWS